MSWYDSIAESIAQVLKKPAEAIKGYLTSADKSFVSPGSEIAPLAPSPNGIRFGDVIRELPQATIDETKSIAKDILIGAPSKVAYSLAPDKIKPTVKTISDFVRAKFGMDPTTSYAKDVESEINKGTPPLVAALSVGSKSILDVVQVGGLIDAGASALVKNIRPAEEAVLRSWEALGRPANMQEAQTTYRSLAHVLHPDAGGDAATFSRLNNAYSILQKEGIPPDPASLLQKFRSVGEILKTDVTDLGGSRTPEGFIKPAGYLPGYRSINPEMQPAGLSTNPVEPVGFGADSPKEGSIIPPTEKMAPLSSQEVAVERPLDAGALSAGQPRMSPISSFLNPTFTRGENGNITTDGVKILDLEVSKNVQDQAFMDTVIQNPKGGIKGFTTELRNAYIDWVNHRAAANLKASITSRDFKGLDKGGIDTILEFQRPGMTNMSGQTGTPIMRKGKIVIPTGKKFQNVDLAEQFKAVKQYFDTKYGQLQALGINFPYKADYLPQLWYNSEDEILKAANINRFLTRRPSFTLDSVFESYKDGIDAGLTPRITKISDLVAWYDRKAEQTIADHKFFQYLTDGNLIQPANRAPLGWKELVEGFPRIKSSFYEGSTVVEYHGTYKAPPELADAINTYLRAPESKALKKFADFATIVKNIVLSSGIPKTGINAHGINILARNVLASKNPIGGFLKGTYYLLNPAAAEKSFLELSKRAQFFVDNGLRISGEEFDFAKDLDKTLLGSVKLQKVIEAQEKLFSDPLFLKVIPALKVQHADVIFHDLVKSGTDQQEAAHISARIVNNIFGGLNLAELGRSKDTQNFLRATLLAPDWAEAQVRLGGNVFKSFVKPFDPRYKAYRRFARNLFMAYMAANVMNKATSGRWMYQNDPGHTFQIQIGELENGKKRYVAPFGTGADFVRLPYDVALGLAKGDLSSIFKTVRNRLSMPLGSLMGLISNVDYMGRPLYGKDRYGRPIPIAQQVGGVASQLSDLAVPQYGQALIDAATGRITPEEAASQALELPLRYSSAPKPQVRF